MPLYLFLLVIISLCCGTLPESMDVDFVRTGTASITLICGWSLLAHIVARMIAKTVLDQELSEMAGARLVERAMEAFRWGGLVLAVGCLAGFGLGRVIQSQPYLGESMFLQALILLAPASLITLATWSAEHFYGLLLGYVSGGFRQYFRMLVTSVRSAAAWIVVPILSLLLISDVVTHAFPRFANNGWVLAVAALILVPIALPWLVGRLFKTEPIDHETSNWIGDVLNHAGVRRTRVIRWSTGGKVFNAMVTGFVPPFRSLLVSDRLLDQLTRPQIAMVVLHEAAHLRRKHVPLRMLGVLPAWIAGGLITKISGDNPYGMLLGCVAGVLLTTLLLRIISLRTEFDADDFACRLAEKFAGKIDGVPTTYADAAMAMSEALIRVTESNSAARRATWLHPGLDERLQNMGVASVGNQTSELTEPAV